MKTITYKVSCQRHGRELRTNVKGLKSVITGTPRNKKGRLTAGCPMCRNMGNKGK
jgi:hypothetical protein